MSVFRNLINCIAPIRKTIFSTDNGLRTISITAVKNLREISEVKEGNKLVIEAKYVESPRSPFLLKAIGDSCPVCASNLDIKHTDVLILSQFVRTDGCMLPRRITGLCRLQQKRIANMVAMAQKAGLMANIAPLNSKKDPTKRKLWKKYNAYFDESTIRPPRKRHWLPDL